MIVVEKILVKIGSHLYLHILIRLPLQKIVLITFLVTLLGYLGRREVMFIQFCENDNTDNTELMIIVPNARLAPPALLKSNSMYILLNPCIFMNSVTIGLTGT